MKKLKVIYEYSSIFNDAKWLISIKMFNFSSIRQKDNIKIGKKIKALIEEYNITKCQCGNKAEIFCKECKEYHCYACYYDHRWSEEK